MLEKNLEKQIKNAMLAFPVGITVGFWIGILSVIMKKKLDKTKRYLIDLLVLLPSFPILILFIVLFIVLLPFLLISILFSISIFISGSLIRIDFIHSFFSSRIEFVLLFSGITCGIILAIGKPIRSDYVSSGEFSGDKHLIKLLTLLGYRSSGGFSGSGFGGGSSGGGGATGRW
jgi:hypothetical protein